MLERVKSMQARFDRIIDENENTLNMPTISQRMTEMEMKMDLLINNVNLLVSKLDKKVKFISWRTQSTITIRYCENNDFQILNNFVALENQNK